MRRPLTTSTLYASSLSTDTAEWSTIHLSKWSQQFWLFKIPDSIGILKFTANFQKLPRNICLVREMTVLFTVMMCK